MTRGTEYFISVIQVATTPAPMLAATLRESGALAATGAHHYSQNTQSDLVASSTGTANSTLGGVYAEVS
jgi:hypothetical protein